MTLSMMRTYRCNVTSWCGVYSLVLLQVGADTGRCMRRGIKKGREKKIVYSCTGGTSSVGHHGGSTALTIHHMQLGIVLGSGWVQGKLG